MPEEEVKPEEPKPPEEEVKPEATPAPVAVEIEPQKQIDFFNWTKQQKDELDERIKRLEEARQTKEPEPEPEPVKRKRGLRLKSKRK